MKEKRALFPPLFTAVLVNTYTGAEKPGSRHIGVISALEIADSVDARTCPQKTADIDGEKSGKRCCLGKSV